MIKNKRARNIVRIALLVGTLISLYFVPWILVKAWILPLPGTVQEQLDEAIDHGFSGVIVYVDQAGHAPMSYAAGWHNKEKKIPARPDALFKIASISKLYVAVAISKLAARGRLSLDDTVADHFPELKGRIQYADQITLRMLVQHRSGIPNYTDTYNYWVSPKESNTENLALILDKPADFKPDARYAYCNTNYLLLGETMDRVLGYPHFQFIREAILDRLDLHHTYGGLYEADIENVMSGYHVGYAPDLKQNKVGMIATAEDVGIFLRALNDGSVFDKGEQEIYTSIYGYEHTGLVPGYQSIARYHKDMNAVIIQFTGPTNFKGYNWNLADIVYGRVVKIVRRHSDK